MAENVLETKIQLRYGTYSQWMNSDVILMQGEAAICAFPQERVVDQLSNTTPINTPPAIGIKIGDGYRYFYQLPWVQAIAADVYNWAKQETKPTYTALEISGLQSYIEDNFHISGDITIAPRIYQIVRGTGTNNSKYYLQYKENNEDSDWVIDTNHPIDLTTYNDIYNWIGQSTLDDYMTIGDFITYIANRRINTLNYTDSPNTHQFVTSVSQRNGIIDVARAQPSFSDISGTASVSQGGTGTSTFPIGEVLMGNGTDPITTIPIAQSIANNDYLVTNKLVKQYVDTATAGLTGAMHFVGEAAVAITPYSSVDPRINGYNFGGAQAGDVILYGQQEYVWDGGQWVLLGDEGSYAVKGSIKNADIAADAEIDQSKIAGLDTSFDSKVDKIEGKTLSSNDFTDELKQKLEDIGTNAETNVIEHIMVNGVEVPSVTINQIPKTVNLQIQEFNEAAQNKLANVEANAQVNKVEKVIYDGLEILPDASKVITITSDPHTEHENVIEGITVNGAFYTPDKNKNVNIIIDQAALNLNVLEGAQVPSPSGMEEVEQVKKKLQLARIAVSGDVKELKQTIDTYIILDCGDSTTVI